MPKTKFSSRIKIALLRIMEALGTTASHWASNAKLRVQEINMEARRHEILTGASLQAFELWHNGVKLPKELSDMFKELSDIDDRLSILRAQKYAKVKAEAENGKEGGEAVPPAEEGDCAAPKPPAEKEPPAQKAAAEKPHAPEEARTAPASETATKPLAPIKRAVRRKPKA